MIATMDLYMDEGQFPEHPKETLSHVLSQISVVNILALQPNETLNLYDKLDHIVGAVFWKSLEGPLQDDCLAVGLGKNATGE